MLVFIHNGGINEKVLYSPDFKMVFIFLVTKIFPKGYNNVQLSTCLTLTWDAMSCNGKRNAWWPKCGATPSPRKIGCSVQTKPKWTIPFDQPTEISGILGWMEIKHPGLLSLKDTKVYTEATYSLFTQLLSAVFAENLSHTVDQFNKYTSPKAVENKTSYKVQLAKLFCVHYFQNILRGSRKYP